jgi:hypothetical protein
MLDEMAWIFVAMKKEDFRSWTQRGGKACGDLSRSHVT